MILTVCKDLHTRRKVINILGTSLPSQEIEPVHNSCSFSFLEDEMVSKLKWGFYQSMEVGGNWLL